MRESEVENYLCDKIKKIGGLSLKLNSTSMAGLPDRLVLLPGGQVYFIELKAPGQKPRPLQVAVHKRLSKLNFNVLVIDSKQGVDSFIKKVKEHAVYTSSLSRYSNK